MPFFQTPFFRFLILIVLMILAGVLGGFCRDYFDPIPSLSDEKKSSSGLPRRRFAEVVVPGVAGSFMVPLFLSLGKSAVLAAFIDGKEAKDVFENILIVFGFCLLGSIYAKGFVSGLAARALRLAGEAKAEASVAKTVSTNAEQSATEAKEVASETAENTGDAQSPYKPIAPAVQKNLLESVQGDAERAIVEAFLKRPKIKRATSSLSAELGVARPQIYKAIDALVERDVAQLHTSRTGSNLYRLSDRFLENV